MSDADETSWRALADSRLPTPEAAGLSLSRWHRLLLVVGGLLTLGVLVGVLAPGLVAALGLSNLLVFVLGVVALGLASRAGYTRLRRGERATNFEIVETRRDVARPGAEVDEYLRDATASNTGESTKGYRVSQGHHARKMVRRRLSSVAERVLRHRDRVDAETAREAIESGTWTADEAASTLFSDGEEDDAPGDEGSAITGDREWGERPLAAADDGPDYEVARESETTAGGTGESETTAGGADETPAASPITPCPPVSVESESGIEARISSLLGGGTDFSTAATRATASLAAAVPGLNPERVDAGTPPVDAESASWREGVWETEHWRGVGGIGLLVVGLAALAEAPKLAFAATVFVGYAGYAWLLTPPEPALAVERTFEPADPSPGDRVTVSVTVRNEGDRLLPDCRLIDEVPDRLAVVSGSPRHATALAAGESATFAYDVLAVAGTHEFTDLAVAVRDASAQRERSRTVETDGATLSCEPAPVTESVPLHPQASGVVGRVPTDVGGSGTAFHTVREYRQGDPLDRIDWNRKARTGELGTLQFDEEHAATVVLVVDVRPAAALAPGPSALSAVDRGLGGASQLLDTLLADGDRVGLATMGLDWDYVRPATGGAHRTSLQNRLAREEMRDATAGGYSFNPSRFRRQLKRRLPNDAQVILFSPLCDDDAVTLAQWLHARGHRVTVFSPDPTGTGTVGGVLEAVDRTLNLSTLRSAGIRVVDWEPDGSLQTAVDRAQGRWSA